jgi:hypothetical protein
MNAFRVRSQEQRRRATGARWRTVFVATLGAAVTVLGSEIPREARSVRLTRHLHHGERESLELVCAEGEEVCRVAKRRGGVLVAEASLAPRHAEEIVGAFFRLLPARPMRSGAADRSPLFRWHVEWAGRRVEGVLERDERRPDEPFVAAALSLEGALVGQLYRRSTK